MHLHHDLNIDVNEISVQTLLPSTSGGCFKGASFTSRTQSLDL